MKLSCPAYKSDNPDPNQMELYKALHEQLRNQYRKKMFDQGWLIRETEMPIENEVVKGKIDDVFQSKDGRIVTATEYVSSYKPKMYKFFDASISAGWMRHELGIDASARVVSSDGVETEISNELIEGTWSRMMSEDFQEILSLSPNELLQYANPASGICNYCANIECQKKPPKS